MQRVLRCFLGSSDGAQGHRGRIKVAVSEGNCSHVGGELGSVASVVVEKEISSDGASDTERAIEERSDCRAENHWDLYLRNRSIQVSQSEVSNVDIELTIVESRDIADDLRDVTGVIVEKIVGSIGTDDTLSSIEERES